jgi:hypothetical protein
MLVLLLASAMAGAFLDHADYCLEFNERWPQHAADEVVWEAGRTLELELDGVHHRARVPLEPAYIQTLALLHEDSWTPRSTRTVAFEHAWTHLRQRGHTVVIRTFQPQTWAYDAAALTEAHALRFVDDDRAWTTADKNAVFGALAAVSPRVLPIARGLTLSRTRYISETAVATYSTDGHVIRFSDGVRRVCPDGFEVASGRPAPRGTGSMLHEIGHAVGYAVRASYRRRRVQLDVLIDDLRTDLWGADGETGRYGDIQRGWADSATLRATLVAAFEPTGPAFPETTARRWRTQRRQTSRASGSIGSAWRPHAPSKPTRSTGDARPSGRRSRAWRPRSGKPRSVCAAGSTMTAAPSCTTCRRRPIGSRPWWVRCAGPCHPSQTADPTRCSPCWARSGNRPSGSG